MTLIKSISGIRGTIGGPVGDNLTPLDVVKFAAAYGSWLINRGQQKKVLIGRDARISGPMVSGLIAQTLCALGIDVEDLGLSTTPSVEWAVQTSEAGGGIIVTASHNPSEWNALKLLNEKGEFLSAADGEQVLALAESENFDFSSVSELGNLTSRTDSIGIHIDAVLEYPHVDVEAIRQANFGVVYDAVNSSGAVAIPSLLAKLGVQKIKGLNDQPTGNFAHNPEPLPENLTGISDVLAGGGYDLGIVVDPDVDRLAILNEDGSMFGEEYTLVAVSDYLLAQKAGPTVSNLSSTRALRDITEQQGQSYHASAVGEVNVVTKMKQVGAVIGGEGNGGIIVPDFHYGRDALVGIALFLTHLAKKKLKCSELRSTYPSYHISKNKIQLTAGINVDEILKKVADNYSNEEVNREDGVKIDFPDEWVHLRKSNTEPIIRIYAEAKSENRADELAKRIVDEITEIIN